MDRKFQEYRFSWIEAQNITRARLEAQFKDGIGNLEEIEKAIEQLITPEPTCVPWRTSEIEQAGSRDGTRMAALEFYRTHRRKPSVRRTIVRCPDWCPENDGNPCGSGAIQRLCADHCVRLAEAAIPRRDQHAQKCRGRMIPDGTVRPDKESRRISRRAFDRCRCRSRNCIAEPR